MKPLDKDMGYIGIRFGRLRAAVPGQTFWIFLLCGALVVGVSWSIPVPPTLMGKEPLTTVNVSYEGRGGDAITIGLPIEEGRVFVGDKLDVRGPDGDVDEQWNPLVQWRTDDSVLHGVLTFVVTSPGQYEVYIEPAEGI